MPFQIGFLLFPGLTQLDLTGPAQVLSRMSDSKVHYVWKTLDPVPSDAGLSLLPNASFETCPDLDLLVVPGGGAVDMVMEDEAAMAWVRRQGAQARYVASVCTGSLILGAAGPLVVQLIAWKLLFGSWFIYSYGGERFDFMHLHLAEVLFSPRHGWFYWHPLLLIALVPFIAGSVRRVEGRAWLASLGAIVLLNAAWPMWWLGSSFGQRGFEAATFFAMLGFAWWLRASATRAFWRRLLIGVTAAAIVWNALLFALFLSQRISREEPVTYVAAVRALAGWIGNSR